MFSFFLIHVPRILVFIFSDTEPVIQNFSTTPYVILLHNTVDAVPFFQNFL
jgi:hypothetical protein